MLKLPVVNLFSLRLDEISGAASKEFGLEKAMEKMKSEWKDMYFEFVPYRDTVSACRKQKIYLTTSFDMRTLTLREAAWPSGQGAGLVIWRFQIQASSLTTWIGFTVFPCSNPPPRL